MNIVYKKKKKNKINPFQVHNKKKKKNKIHFGEFCNIFGEYNVLINFLPRIAASSSID